MNSNQHKFTAFTLIELLTIIAVIGILAGILIPLASGVIKQARIAASKARLWQYITAIENFKAEYNYYPSVYGNGNNGNGLIDCATNSANFIEALSGRDNSSGAPKSVGGNYRQIQFYSFSENEFQNQDYTTNRLSDPFNNIYIYVMIDVDGDGKIRPYSSDPATPGEIRGNATAWVAANGDKPGYALWE